MTTVLLIFIVIISGYIIGKYSSPPELFRYNDLITNIFLYLLLFVFGITFGRQSELIKEMGQLGLEIVILTSGGILGSVILARLLWVFYDRGVTDEE